VFHRWPFKTVTAWNREVQAPMGAKSSAVVSLALWASIISCGRFIAYF